ncbi:MAG: 2Fe-2S iron-sulfur cluster-binding protein [Rubrivivax sp.]|nr:2Fe-2S iron-sulfur cluster-binding protein [Rubrivivax sp.]
MLLLGIAASAPTSMTAIDLLSFITAALLLQLAAGIGWTVWRRRAAQVTAKALAPAAKSVKADAAWSGWREFRVAQCAFEDAAQSQCSFYLQPVDGQPLPPFKPGQFLTFALDVTPRSADAASTARVITRCYSLSDRPESAHYRVTIKRVPAPAEHPEFDPGLSSNHFHERVQVGDTLRVKAPAGHFFIDPDPTVPAVLIGGGIGITPLRAMLHAALAQARPVVLHHAARTEAELLYRAEFEALAAQEPRFRYLPTLSRPDHGWSGARGRLDAARVLALSAQAAHAEFYLCAGQPMMDALRAGLVALGIHAEHIHHEAFGAGSAAAASGLEIRVGADACTTAGEPTLLATLEEAGLAPESECRAGTCGLCRMKLAAGEVTWLLDTELALKRDEILPCICVAAGDLQLHEAVAR